MTTGVGMIQNVAVDEYQIDGHCVSVHFPWSIVDSSTPNAHLAATLAGFMVTAIVFLLRLEAGKDDAAASRTHTIAMFLTGVVVLGLDSYLFGSVASVHPVTHTISQVLNTTPQQTESVDVAEVQANHVCAVAWTQGVVASGMLAVGGALLVAGLGWTTTQFAKSIEHRSWVFVCLGNAATLAVTLTCIAALWDTSYLYIGSMQSPPFSKSMNGGNGSSVVWGCVAGGLVFIIIAWRTVGLWWQLRRGQQWGDWPDLLAPTPLPRNSRWWRRLVRWLGHRRTAVAAATWLSVVLAVVGPIFARSYDTAALPDVRTMWWAVRFGLHLPFIILICIAYAVPGPPFKFWKHSDSDSAPTTSTSMALTPIASALIKAATFAVILSAILKHKNSAT